jgi:rhodanese-related sulfurtransferase
MNTPLARTAPWRASATARALLLALLAVFFVVAQPAISRADDKISAPQAYAAVQAGTLLLIDVRSPREWKETGVPAGAKLVTIHNPRGANGFLEDILKAAGGDKTKSIALICAVGNRSSRGKRFLEARGFTNVHDVSEGMFGRGELPGWVARKLPVRKYNP